MFNTTTIEPYIAQPNTTYFRWGWDFNNWVPWMLHYPFRPPRKTHPMLTLKPKNLPSSLIRYSTSTNRFRIFHRSPMLSTSNSMINTRCHTNFRWERNFGFTCRKRALQDHIESFFHSTMDLIPSPRLWVTMIFTSTFPPSLSCTPCLMSTSFNHTFHHYWTP
jgi:hypothetical protein